MGEDERKGDSMYPVSLSSIVGNTVGFTETGRNNDVSAMFFEDNLGDLERIAQNFTPVKINVRIVDVSIPFVSQGETMYVSPRKM